MQRAIDRQERNSKRLAYRRLFVGDGKEPMGDAATVLDDLRRFCRADRSSVTVSPVSGMIDPYATAFAEGRREVWIRIQQFLNHDEPSITTEETND